MANGHMLKYLPDKQEGPGFGQAFPYENCCAAGFLTSEPVRHFCSVGMPGELTLLLQLVAMLMLLLWLWH